MLEIRFADDGNIHLIGKLDASQSPKASEALERINDSIVLDLSELNYISSAGLGVLIAASQRLTKEGKSLKLINVNDHIRNIFHYARLEKLFDIT